MKRHPEFTLTRTHGKAKGGAYLVLSTLKQNEVNEPTKKFGIIVTKKVGNAVVRNKLRRRVHAIYAKHAEHMQDETGNRYIVTILRWRAPDATFSQLENDWLKQANRLGILTSK